MTIREISKLIMILEAYGGDLWAHPEYGDAPEIIMDMIKVINEHGYDLKLVKLPTPNN